MTQITDFIPQYQEVNVIFSRFLESEKFGFILQKNITHFYNRYKDVKLFEKMIFDIIFSKDSRREKMLLSSIKFEIDRNITIYETGRRYFDEIEMENVNDDAAVKYLEEIRQARQRAKRPLISRLSWQQRYETVRSCNTRHICHRRSARFSMLIPSRASTIAIRCSNALCGWQGATLSRTAKISSSLFCVSILPRGVERLLAKPCEE